MAQNFVLPVTLWIMSGALVSGEVAGCGKRFVASLLITDIGSGPCMGAFVGGEIAGYGKRFMASIL
ncbi:hypothetical protein, partial [Sansalvadorimonas verongulae]|uniref:hypothetical protein n=1 Tax=Sansalvadorimonas verongulae TaxID=2172824 RepID=UPI001E37ABBC